MTDQAYDSIDYDCPTVDAFVLAMDADLDAAGIRGLNRHTTTVEKLNAFAVEHKSSCPRCRGIVRRDAATEEEGPSPIWGGATLGLFVGLIVGFFRENYWQTVLYAVGIGAALGLGSEVLARVGNFIIRRKRGN